LFANIIPFFSLGFIREWFYIFDSLSSIGLVSDKI